MSLQTTNNKKMDKTHQSKTIYDWIRISQPTIINSNKMSLKNKHMDNLQRSMVPYLENQ